MIIVVREFRIGDVVRVVADNIANGTQGKVVKFEEPDPSHMWIEWSSGSRSRVPTEHLDLVSRTHVKVSSPEAPIPHLTPSAHQRHYRGTTMKYASASADVSPAPVGPTLARVGECNNRINDINSSLDVLEDSMRIGLSHHHGEAGGVKDAETIIKPVPSVPLHGSLDELGERLTTTWHRINELTARVNL